MASPLRVSRLKADKKGKRVAENYDATETGSSEKSDAATASPGDGSLANNWRDSLPEETRKACAKKLFDLTTIGVADDDVYKAALAVEDEVFTEATSLSDYKTRMAAKYDAVIPTVVSGQTKSKEAAQRIFLTAQTFFDDDNFRTSGHRRLAKATHSAYKDFFGGRLEPRAEAFKAHFKASDANRKEAIGHGLDTPVSVQPHEELADVDKEIEKYYSA